jgi:hypothetical protein
MKIRTIQLPFMTLSTNSTSNLFLPATGWLPTDYITQMRPTWELRQANGNIQLSPAYQVADHEDSPGTSTALATLTSSTGMQYPTGWTDVSSSLGGKQLVRFGWIVNLTSGSTLATAFAGGRVQLLTE